MGQRSKHLPESLGPPWFSAPNNLRVTVTHLGAASPGSPQEQAQSSDIGTGGQGAGT